MRIRPVCVNCGETRPYKICPVCKFQVEVLLEGEE